MNVAEVMGDAIGEAKWRAEAILAHVDRGRGDTVEAQAYRAQSTYGVPASTLLRLVYRHDPPLREIRNMNLSSWLPVMLTWEAIRSKMESAADEQKRRAEKAGANANNSRCFAVATLLDRREDGTENERESK